MSLLKQYLLKTERTHKYRIKTIVELNDERVDVIEKVLAKYVPIDMSEIYKTILQKHPLDFHGVENAEVYFVDVELTLGPPPYVLQQEIYKALKTADKFVIVRGENDPMELQNLQMAADAEMREEADKKGMKPARLLDTPDYPEAADVNPEDYYGDKYNAKLVDYLTKIEREHEKAIELKNAPRPFGWLDAKDQEPVQSDENFNDPVKPARSVRPATSVGSFANNYDNKKTVKRAYTKDGKTEKVLSRTIQAVDTKDK